MKHFSILYMSALILLSAGIAKAQTPTDTIRIDRSYERSKARPTVAPRHSLIINDSDSLFLVNSIRFHYYEELRSLLSDSTDYAMAEVILKYERVLKENDLQYELLAKQCEEQSAFYDRSLEDIRSSLTLTDNTLQLTQQSLQSASGSLQEANEMIRSSRGRTFWDKLSIAGGGVGLGLLIGVLVAQ